MLGVCNEELLSNFPCSTTTNLQIQWLISRNAHVSAENVVLQITTRIRIVEVGKFRIPDSVTIRIDIRDRPRTRFVRPELIRILS